jgi:hypothetical protein
MKNIHLQYKNETGLNAESDINVEFLPQNGGIYAADGKVITSKSDLESMPCECETCHADHGYGLIITFPTLSYIKWLEEKVESLT